MSKNSAIRHSWDEIEQELFTPKEIAASNLRASLIGEVSGVKQSIIARIEKGQTKGFSPIR